METAEEKYLIQRAKAASDPNVAKAIILTAKTLYPQNFSIQFMAYVFEKNAKNYEKAATSLSLLLRTFQNQQPPELWTEIGKLTEALRMPDDKTTESDEEDFYIKMFQHISYEVQHSILLLTASNSDNQMDHCRLILLFLKRFPQAIVTHAPRLIDTLIQGMQTNLIKCREILVLEALPLIMTQPVELPPILIERILFVTFEFYMHRMFTHPEEKDEAWRKVFEVMENYSKALKWETFLPYTKTCSKEVYWERVFLMVSSATSKPSESKQIVYYATILFMMSIQDYVENVNQKVGDVEQELVLVEGISLEKRRKIEITGPPHISVTQGCSPETPICLVVAAQCWQLLHSNDILQKDFTQMIVNISSPLTKWVNRFLLDLAIYLRRNDEALSLMKDSHADKSELEKSVRLLSLTISQGSLNIQGFEHILSILRELPTTPGNYLPNKVFISTNRQLLLLPLTKKAVLQYCVKAIIVCLRQKLTADPNAPNLLGNLLVLCQLDWPNEIATAENIFDIIRQRRAFSYLLFPNYIINVEMIEEFMHMFYPGEIKLEFTISQSSNRRIGTRGSDKGVKDDFIQIIKQQINRSNEDIDNIIIQFLQQEHVILVQTLFDK